VALENRAAPGSGAIVTVSWPRQAFANQQAAAQTMAEQRAQSLDASLQGGLG
jgi:hypothetical protein